jgi:hypothetical protein
MRIPEATVRDRLAAKYARAGTLLAEPQSRPVRM